MNEDLKEKSILVIVESPTKVKSVSEILKKAGYKKAMVAASVGHIIELKDGGPCFNSGIYPDKDFEMKLAISADKAKVVANLKPLIKAAEYVYLMTDGDREGEVISWSLIEFLKIPKSKCRRAITHEITPKAVIAAIENPMTLNMNLVNAGKSRMMLDKLIGYGLSPAARKCIGAKSVGRCQSVGLALVVDRENEILNFVPERFYTLSLSYEKYDREFIAKYAGTDGKRDNKFTDVDELQKVMDACLPNNYYVSDISTVSRLEYPKPPFCTATFQQEASSKLGLSVKAAMSNAQKLYEGISVGGQHVGLITYMRTDSTELAAEFLPELKTYIETRYGSGMYHTPKVGKKTGSEQDGHEALRVVSVDMTPEKLQTYISNDILLKVYKLIWQRTVASAMPPAEIAETTYTIQNNGQYFKYVDKLITKPGYRLAAPPQYVSIDCIPATDFVVGEKLEKTKLVKEEDSTKPKSRYTEAALVKELQSREIGRPSTYATIVETILSASRGYAELDDKKIVPTERGMQLAAFCNRAFPNIINYDYTKQMELCLDKIANGELNWLDYMKAFYSDLVYTIEHNPETEYYQSEKKVCPLCGAPMVIRRNRFGKLFYGCSKYPACHGLENIK